MTWGDTFNRHKATGMDPSDAAFRADQSDPMRKRRAEVDNERLRETLIQADLKIRSFPGADQSDVEFIREALGGTPTPATSSEPVGIDLSEFPDLPSDTRISIRIVSGEMAGTEIDNVPFSVFTPTPPSRKKPDWRDPFCKRRDENVLSNIRDAYFYGFEDALEIVSEIPTPAPRAGS